MAKRRVGTDMGRGVGALVVAAVALLTAGPAGAGPAGPVAAKTPPAEVFKCTLQGCYERALKHSPQMAAAYTDLDNYEAQLREATSAMYPRFDLTGFFSILPRKKPDAVGENPFVDWDWTKIGPLITGQISVVQVLWTFGKIDTLRRMARTGVRVGRTVRAIAQLELRYQISRGWWALVLADELDEIINLAATHLGKERGRMEDKRDEGEDYNPTDLLRLRMMEADFEQKAREARRARDLASDSLALAMGLSADTRIQPHHDGLAPLAFKRQPMAVWEHLATANHPRLVARRGGTLVRLDQLQLAKDQRWPDVVLTGRVAYTYAPTRDIEDESLASNPTNPTQSGGGVAIRWPLSPFRQSAKIDQAEVALRKARAEEKADLDKIRLEVRRLARELRDADAMVDIHDRAMRAARGWLRAESEMHEGGFEGYDQVLRSIEQYYRRRLEWLNSIYKLNVMVAETSRAVGVDLSTLPLAQAVSATAAP